MEIGSPQTQRDDSESVSPARTYRPITPLPEQSSIAQQDSQQQIDDPNDREPISPPKPPVRCVGKQEPKAYEQTIAGVEEVEEDYMRRMEYRPGTGKSSRTDWQSAFGDRK